MLRRPAPEVLTMKYVDLAALDLGLATPEDAREMIGRLHSEMPAPFYLVAISRVETPDVVAREFSDLISDQPRVTLDEVYRMFRAVEPEGDYCLLLGCGGETRATCPKALLLDTRLLDKAAGEGRAQR
jgi:hypothetical protein